LGRSEGRKGEEPGGPLGGGVPHDGGRGLRRRKQTADHTGAQHRRERERGRGRGGEGSGRDPKIPLRAARGLWGLWEMRRGAPPQGGDPKAHTKGIRWDGYRPSESQRRGPPCGRVPVAGKWPQRGGARHNPTTVGGAVAGFRVRNRWCQRGSCSRAKEGDGVPKHTIQ